MTSLGLGVDLAQTGDELEPRLRVRLLGLFNVNVDGVELPESAWQQRRAAKSLIKLLAIEPSHTLHRDQILQILWPDASVDSATNSFGKALHAARRALESSLPARGQSSYLHLRSDVLSFDTENVWVDIDHFRKLADEALRQGDVRAHETALAAYTGELLPEDRYENWVSDHAGGLTASYVHLLLTGAEALERHGSVDKAVAWLRRALKEDETREDIHRRLMRLHLQAGNRHEALRQYLECREVLRREVDAEPEPETEALYEAIRANRIEKMTLASIPEPAMIPPVINMWGSMSTPFVGRDRVLQRLHDEMDRADGGNGGVVLISGEPGAGKTRVVAEFAHRVAQTGVLTLWGFGSVHGDLMPFGPFVEALESYVARLPSEERTGIADRYPELRRLLPSLSHGARVLPESANVTLDRTRLFPAIVCLLSDLAYTRPLLLVLSDIHASDSGTIQLLQYLVHLAIQRRWLVLATYREEDVPPRSELGTMLRSTATARLCRTIELRCLAREDCARLVAALLPEAVADEALLDYVYGLSLGNPLFVQELVGTMRARGELTLENSLWRVSSLPRSVPRQVRNLVEESIGHLESDVQRVLSLAAMAEAKFSLEDLQVGAAALQPPIPNSVLSAALDQALRSRILEEWENHYEFRHPLFRAALHEHVSHHRRLEFKAALANPGANGHGRGKQSVRSLEDVARRTEDLPPNRVAATYGELSDRLDRLGRSPESAVAREKLADALIRSSKYERAWHVLREAEQLYRGMRDEEGLARVRVLLESLSLERIHLIRD
jgi:DNA-binding SARP family transcriptional activator